MGKQKKRNTYLIFKMSNEKFAINVMQVSKIIDFTNCAKVPFSADYMIGIFNLAGKAIPLLNGRNLLGYKNCEYNESFKIIIIDYEIDGVVYYAGLLVDKVHIVSFLKNNEVQAINTIGKNFRSPYIKGVVNQNGDFIMLLDFKQLFMGEEWKEFQEQHVVEVETSEAC